jgi:hypothetical protein
LNMSVKDETDNLLSSLIDEVVNLSERLDNVKRKNFWERFYCFKEPDRIPIQIWMNDSGWARHMNQDLRRIFEDPKEYVIFRLNIILSQQKYFLDDTPVTASVDIGFGPALVPSLFGIEPIFRSDSTPWPGGGTTNQAPLIQNEDDLDRMEYPDFRNSGLMPEVHRFYEVVGKLVGADLAVGFPAFIGTHPWEIAEKMRGFENLLMDTYLNPGLVHKLMNYIVESMGRLEKERERFLGIGRKNVELGADAVDCNKISPECYLEFIHPYERKLAKMCDNGITCYHSCGNITPLLEHISKIPGIKILHCSPWTDFETAVNICKRNAFILEKRMHSVNEILLPNQEEMEHIARQYANKGRGVTMFWGASLDGDSALDKLRMWATAARRVLGEKRISN